MNRSAVTPALRTGEFVPLVALLISLVALAIDAMLPALPAIAEDLGVARRNDVQYVVTSLFLGLSLGQIIFGPLSDRIGRKPAIYAGLLLFMAGCLMSIYAHSFELMIAGRVLQGIGVASPRIVSVALVRDQYEGREMARLMSFTMALFVLVPGVAPALGQGIMWLGGWRAIFASFFAVAAVALAWCALRQPETLPAANRRPLSPRAIGSAVLQVFRMRAVMGYTIASGFIFTPFLAYLSASQQIFQEAYDTGALFPLYFGGLALVIGVASLANARLVMKYGMRRLSNTVILLSTVASFAFWGLTFFFAGLPPFWMFMSYQLFVFVCLGPLFGNLNALAMQPLGKIAGLGATVVASLATLMSVPLGAMVALRFDGTLYVLAGSFALFSAAAMALMKWADKHTDTPHNVKDS